MRVRMKQGIGGYRNGEPWPAIGGCIDLPDHEAADLIVAGYAAAAELAEDQEVDDARTAGDDDEDTASHDAGDTAVDDGAPPSSDEGTTASVVANPTVPSSAARKRPAKKAAAKKT